MNKVKSSKATTKRLVASGIMLFGGLLTFTNKPQDAHAEDGVAPVKETNTTAAESSNVAVLKSSVKPNEESGSKAETSGEEPEVILAEPSSETTKIREISEEQKTAAPVMVSEKAEAATSTTSTVTPAPAADTTPTNAFEEISKTFTVKGKQYRLSSKAFETYYPMFSNVVRNLTDGPEWTYSYFLGDSSSSAYYMRDESGKYKVLTGYNGHTLENVTKVTIEKTTDSISKTFTTYDGSFEVREILTIGDAEIFEHTVTVKNLTGTDMNNVSFGVRLDTMLAGEGASDNTPIHASGDGGAFIWNDALTVYANGAKGVNVYVGKYSGTTNDIADRQPVPGVYQENVVTGKDSALQYETGKVNLSAGGSYTFQFNEKVRPGSHELGKLTVRYVDTEGNVIHPEQVLQDTVGESWSVTPMKIDGFTFKEAGKALTGTYTKAPKILTLIYKKDAPSTLPDTEDPKTPAKQETPVKPTTPVKPATPTQKTPVSNQIVAPQTNKVLPQTGEKSTSVVSVIGVGILATLSLLGLAKLRKQNN